MLVEGGIEFFKVSEPVLAFRRTAPGGSMLCVFNLSAEPVRVTIENAPNGTEPLPMSEGADLARTRLGLAANGFAFIAEAADSRFGVKFNRRAKTKRRH